MVGIIVCTVLATIYVIGIILWVLLVGAGHVLSGSNIEKLFINVFCGSIVWPGVVAVSIIKRFTKHA